METRESSSTLTLTGRIDKQIYDASELRDNYDNWERLSKSQKVKILRNNDAESSETVYNVTTDNLHEYFVDNLDPGQSSSQADITEIWVGLGTDSGSGTSTSDTDLNNRVYEEEISDVADNGKELLASAFIDSAEANGNVLNEIGLFSNDPSNLGDADTFLINHATFANVTKDSSKTVLFDVRLEFSDI